MLIRGYATDHVVLGGVVYHYHCKLCYKAIVYESSYWHCNICLALYCYDCHRSKHGHHYVESDMRIR